MNYSVKLVGASFQVIYESVVMYKNVLWCEMGSCKGRAENTITQRVCISTEALNNQPGKFLSDFSYEVNFQAY